MTLSHLIYEPIIKAALKEDLGHGHDITSALTIPAGVEATAVLRARSHGVLAGLIPSLSAFSYVDDMLEITVNAADGDLITEGQTLASITGDARAIMMAERVCLNTLTHLSGIATYTMAFVDEVLGTNAKICDTRKTLPNLRALQKYAVTCGGGHNHRHGLDDAVLIKDNHIAIAGGITKALNAAQNTGHTVKIEIEVDTLVQLEEVLQHGGAHIVMLDNFETSDLIKAVSMIDGKIISEASGGVRLDTVKDIAATGVDYISIGALTHSAPALDIGLDIEINQN